MPEPTNALDRTAEQTQFSGVVATLGAETDLVRAYGMANRSTGTPVTADTRFGMASGSKAMTAIVIASLVSDGTLTFETRARELLGSDLPLIDDAVTVLQLLTHTSGIGDYLDEETWEPSDHVLSRSAHTYLTPSDFLADLDGHPQVAAPGEQCVYCNGGYAVLAVIAERAGGHDYYGLVRTRVLEPAGMADSGFFRSDRLPERTALGYLGTDDDALTNVFHLPVMATGDGGMYTTAADTHRFWSAFLGGRIVDDAMVQEMLRPHATDADGGPIGLGFELTAADAGGWDANLDGYDAGVSFASRHVRSTGVTRVVLSNTSEGAWPMWEALLDL
ncbi:serine hydrolase domain-containing protein [Pseudactinotalea sp.]|uniref:serine hydrolase domain-containing protein n=1 Tax=Pseudactinotalea sp. TaxID=1926260 RepID=UPI003B3BD8CA